MRLRKAAFAGFRFQLYLKVFSVASHQLGSLVLAVLLAPRDFAIVGLATVFVGFSSSLADFGLGSAVIQRSGSSATAISTGATLRLLLAIIGILSLAIAAPWIAGLYNAGELTGVIWALSLLLVLSFAGFASRVALTKSLSFKQVFMPEVAGGAVTTFSSIGLAFLGWSYWSLVVGSLLGASVNVLWLYLLSPWELGLHLDRRVASELLRFGLPLVVAGLLASLFGAFGVAVLGIINFSDLGFYLFAFTWGVSVPLGIHTSVDNVMFPVYSAMQMDKNRIRTAFLTTSEQLARVVILMGVFFSVAAPTFIISLVGQKWMSSVPMLRVLGGAGTVLVLSAAYQSLAVSLGHPREITLYNAVGLVIVIPLTLALVPPLGGFGVSLSILGAAAALIVWASSRAERLLHGVLRPLLRIYAVPTVSSIGAGIAVWVLVSVLPVSLFALGVELAVAAIAYIALMEILTGGRFLRQTRELVASFVGR